MPSWIPRWQLRATEAFATTTMSTWICYWVSLCNIFYLIVRYVKKHAFKVANRLPKHSVYSQTMILDRPCIITKIFANYFYIGFSVSQRERQKCENCLRHINYKLQELFNSRHGYLKCTKNYRYDGGLLNKWKPLFVSCLTLNLALNASRN